MSGDRLTSHSEAMDMKRVIDQAVDDLDRAGYGRGQIGAAMAGIALGLVAAHEGEPEAVRVLDAVRAAISGARQ